MGLNGWIYTIVAVLDARDIANISILLQHVRQKREILFTHAKGDVPDLELLIADKRCNCSVGTSNNHDHLGVHFLGSVCSGEYFFVVDGEDGYGQDFRFDSNPAGGTLDVEFAASMIWTG